MRETEEKVLRISPRSLPLEPQPTVLKTGLLHWVKSQVAKVSFSPEWNQIGPRHLKMFLWANIKCVHISQSWSESTLTIILTLPIKQLLSVVMCYPSVNHGSQLYGTSISIINVGVWGRWWIYLNLGPTLFKRESLETGMSRCEKECPLQ